MSSKTTVKTSRFERVDCASDEQDILLNGEAVGTIVKTHAQPAEALSLVDSRGPVSGYEVVIWIGDDERTETFAAKDYESARKAHTAAKTWARTTLQA